MASKSLSTDSPTASTEASATSSGGTGAAMAKWIQFFEAAGIPPGPAVFYAVTFVNNRIHKTMLLDLTEELLKEMGMTVVGNIIAVLKHAKAAHQQEQRRNPRSAAGVRRTSVFERLAAKASADS